MIVVVVVFSVRLFAIGVGVFTVVVTVVVSVIVLDWETFEVLVSSSIFCFFNSGWWIFSFEVSVLLPDGITLKCSSTVNASYLYFLFGIELKKLKEKQRKSRN